jgi:hypothetical protein
MVWHQGIGVDMAPRPRRKLCQKAFKQLAVRVIRENGNSIVPALPDVPGNAGCAKPGFAGHGWMTSSTTAIAECHRQTALRRTEIEFSMPRNATPREN